MIKLPTNPFKKNTRKRATQRRKENYSQTNARRYQSVEIVQSTVQLDSRDLCPAFSAQAGKRYLSTEAPSLPLPGCNKKTCRCKYRYLDDRRSAERRSGMGDQRRPTVPEEQRMLLDRRKT